MISNFKIYSAYYDLLYRDKDYRMEAEYVSNHLKKTSPRITNLLELGSGTGNHARYLSKEGYHITGIERSEGMISIARQKNIPNFIPVLSEIASFQLSARFDAAVSLFHSICYITGNEGLLQSFRNVANHLLPGGIFAFDFWHGPSVTHQPPAPRTKYAENDLVAVTRRGETILQVDKNIAEVDFEITVMDKSNGRVEVIHEKHPMRYFSIPEISFIAGQTGFSMLLAEEFLSGNNPTLESWNVFVVLQKQA